MSVQSVFNSDTSRVRDFDHNSTTQETVLCIDLPIFFHYLSSLKHEQGKKYVEYVLGKITRILQTENTSHDQKSNQLILVFGENARQDDFIKMQPIEKIGNLVDDILKECKWLLTDAASKDPMFFLTVYPAYEATFDMMDGNNKTKLFMCMDNSQQSEYCVFLHLPNFFPFIATSKHKVAQEKAILKKIGNAVGARTISHDNAHNTLRIGYDDEQKSYIRSILQDEIPLIVDNLLTTYKRKLEINGIIPSLRAI